jgi:hypothetical protein
MLERGNDAGTAPPLAGGGLKTMAFSVPTVV